eukprot:scaffold1409_cov245-Pinguiococcus_pyrenoidosus.AAC.11
MGFRHRIAHYISSTDTTIPAFASDSASSSEASLDGSSGLCGRYFAKGWSPSSERRSQGKYSTRIWPRSQKHKAELMPTPLRVLPLEVPAWTAAAKVSTTRTALVTIAVVLKTVDLVSKRGYYFSLSAAQNESWRQGLSREPYRLLVRVVSVAELEDQSPRQEREPVPQPLS